jgi:hypothetical protein
MANGVKKDITKINEELLKACHEQGEKRGASLYLVEF